MNLMCSFMRSPFQKMISYNIAYNEENILFY